MEKEGIKDYEKLREEFTKTLKSIPKKEIIDWLFRDEILLEEYNQENLKKVKDLLTKQP